MKWVVTGACGFIGSNLLEYLVLNGDDVVGLDNVSRPRVHHNLAFLRDALGVQVEIGDIRDREFVRAVMTQHSDADAVVHLAGQVSFLAGESDPVTDFDINALGTLNVCSAAAESIPAVPLLYSSTNKVYGDLTALTVVEDPTRYVLPDLPHGINESLGTQPIGAYAVSKMTGEMVVKAWSERGGIQGVSFRQSSIYGGRQFPTSDQGWAAYFVEAFVADRPYTMNGTGKQVRDLLHVRDLCGAFRQAVVGGTQLRGQSWNIGGGPGNSLSILELTERLAQLTGNEPECEALPDRPHDQKVYVSDNRSFSSSSGWQAGIGVEDGLVELLEWANTSVSLSSQHSGPRK